MLEAIQMCEEISGKKLSYTYEDDNRMGDHIWYVSDVSKFQSHYPDWKLTKDVKTILTEIFEFNTQTLAGTCSMIDRGQFNLLGVTISAVDYEAAVKKIMVAGKQRKPLGVSALAVHGVMTGVMDNEHRHRLNGLELIVPDGQPVRWALNWLHGVKLKDRVYGPNLMLKTCEAAAEQGLSIFLFGGKQELLDQLQASLLKKFPNLKDCWHVGVKVSNCLRRRKTGNHFNDSRQWRRDHDGRFGLPSARSLGLRV